MTATTTKKAAATPKSAAKSPKSVKKAVEKPSPKASPKASPPPKSSPKKESPKKEPAGSPKKSTVSTKPKKALSGYFIWLNASRADIIAKKCGGNGSDVAAVARAAGEMWKGMSDKDKAPFQAKADKDKERYAKEMKSYVPPEGGEPSKKKGKKGKKEKDPNKPKKPSHPYMLWLTENRAELAKDPSVKVVTDVMKIAGEKWKVLPAAQKKKYEAAYAVAKAKFDKEMAEYKANKADDDDDDDEE